MHCIYEIKYDIKWASAEPQQWLPQSVRVFANEDALMAVTKAKEAALAQHRLDENGREDRCVEFRLRGIELVAEAEL
jgi:hypothetical protein